MQMHTEIRSCCILPYPKDIASANFCSQICTNAFAIRNHHHQNCIFITKFSSVFIFQRSHNAFEFKSKRKNRTTDHTDRINVTLSNCEYFTISSAIQEFLKATVNAAVVYIYKHGCCSSHQGTNNFQLKPTTTTNPKTNPPKCCLK